MASQRRRTPRTAKMPEPTDECWMRVKGRLRAEVGDAIYNSWFARMELETLDGETARISVPTRFLKSWIQSHYGERLLSCWQFERPAMRRIDLSVRSAVRTFLPGLAPTPPATAVADTHGSNHVNGHSNGHIKIVTPPVTTTHDPHGGSPLDPRLTFESFVVG